jgi:hypothetical protein
MHVGLGNAGEPGKPPFSELAVVNAQTNAIEEKSSEFFKSHVGYPKKVFQPAIGLADSEL